MSVEGWSVKSSSQQSWTSGPKVKGGGIIFRPGPSYYGGGGGKRYYTSTIGEAPVTILHIRTTYARPALPFYFERTTIRARAVNKHSNLAYGNITRGNTKYPYAVLSLLKA